MKLGRQTISPGVRKKVVQVAAETRSFARAEIVLDVVGEIELSGRHIGRLAKAVGTTLAEQQQQCAVDHQEKQLPVEVENPPELAVVEFDGGRIFTRKEDEGTGVHAPAWRESKNALFLRMKSDRHSSDPAPQLPGSLLNRQNVQRLVQEMAGAATSGEDIPSDAPSEIDSSSYYEPPRRLMRTCLSSLADSREFGKQMQAEAHRKGFFQAPRKAFLGDGMKCNWTIQRKHFAGFVPIADFIHVLSYLYKAAMSVGEGEEFGWGICLEWATACWQGRVAEVIAELARWLDAHPLTDDGEEISDDDPRHIVRRAHTYLTNNRERMDYPSYRKQGLPVTSALMESLIKEINYRVKGSEKSWNDPTGANAILALRAASLSEDDRLQKAITG